MFCDIVEIIVHTGTLQCSSPFISYTYRSSNAYCMTDWHLW